MRPERVAEEVEALLAEALSFADQVAVLRDDRLAEAGPPEDLYRRPSRRDTALFLGDAIILRATLEDGRAHCALGRLATDARCPDGKVEIMLRPEQLSLTAVAAQEADERRDGYGQVTAIEFGGATCLISISLTRRQVLDPLYPQAIVLKSAGVGLPPIGCAVRIVVTGRAHILS